MLFVWYDFQSKLYSKYLEYKFNENLIISIEIYHIEEASQSESTLKYSKIQYLDVYSI